MMSPNSHSTLMVSIERAVAHLADALMELDRIPAGDKATIGFAAHAMNNYLSVSEATLELLGNALRDHPNPDVKRWLDGLNQVSKRMHHSLSRLVNASAPQDFPVKLEALDAIPLMRRACDYYRRSAEEKRLAIAFRGAAETPPIWADTVAVAVIADNLLSNAIKYSHPGGTITVDVQSAPGGVVCSVCNQGTPMTPSEMAQVFRSGLSRGRPSPTAGEPSHGYGLTIAKELVDRMGGRIWVDSDHEKGTCFFFSLPYHAHAEKSRP